MRISDWSSDVCSSDLPDLEIIGLPLLPVERGYSLRSDGGASGGAGGRRRRRDAFRRCPGAPSGPRARLHAPLRRRAGPSQGAAERARQSAERAPRRGGRSEEHTSELQSLMRSSYAVFCLKKKKKYKTNTH